MQILGNKNEKIVRFFCNFCLFRYIRRQNRWNLGSIDGDVRGALRRCNHRVRGRRMRVWDVRIQSRRNRRTTDRNGDTSRGGRQLDAGTQRRNLMSGCNPDAMDERQLETSGRVKCPDTIRTQWTNDENAGETNDRSGIQSRNNKRTTRRWSRSPQPCR